MLDYPIVIGPEALNVLSHNLYQSAYSNILVLVDTNSFRHCYPLLKSHLPPHVLHEIPPGESHKHIHSCLGIWEKLTLYHFDRRSLLINLGGGVIGDMGGFVAGTYKRGIDFVQLPTTLLSQVDASVGGKLGIDFQSYKNHIGLFANPQGVYIDPVFLKTLPENELISGFAEVIKHHLISDAEAWKELTKTTKIHDHNFAALIQHSVDVKSRIVEQDPKEKGARKALNFGHTLGHAIESLYLERGDLSILLHGKAIAIGMVGESYISWKKNMLNKDDLNEISAYIFQYFSGVDISERDYDEIYLRMKQDKKNQTGKILCTLLKGIGAFEIDVEITQEEVLEALEYYGRLRHTQATGHQEM